MDKEVCNYHMVRAYSQPLKGMDVSRSSTLAPVLFHIITNESEKETKWGRWPSCSW